MCACPTSAFTASCWTISTRRRWSAFRYTEVGKRLIGAWAGPSQQTITFAQVQDCLSRFRAYCLEHNLLDFSLQLELFRTLLQHDWFRDKLYRRYRHLIVENVEEDTPLTHDLLRDWIPHTESALIVYDTDAGYRSFLGADARSAYELRSVCNEIVELSESHVMSPAVQSLEATVTHVLSAIAICLREAARRERHWHTAAAAFIRRCSIGSRSRSSNSFRNKTSRRPTS